MKVFRLKLASFVFVAAGLFAWWAHGHLAKERRASAPTSSTHALQGAGEGATPTSDYHLRSISLVGSAAEDLNASPFAHVPASRMGMPLESDPFEAGSVEEQRWLDRNGFPNEEQFRVYSTASEGLLRAAAQSGDRLAKVELDGRLLMQGDQGAVGRLFESAEDGSLYALTKLAGYMAVSRDGSHSLAYSISRVQEIRGDTRIALARDILMRKPLDPLEKAEAEMNALKMAKELELRFRGGVFRDPRPFP